MPMPSLWGDLLRPLKPRIQGPRPNSGTIRPYPLVPLCFKGMSLLDLSDASPLNYFSGRRGCKVRYELCILYIYTVALILVAGSSEGSVTGVNGFLEADDKKFHGKMKID